METQDKPTKVVNQTSSSWLSKNTASIIGLMWTMFSLCIYILVLLHKLTVGEPTVLLVINSITNIVMLIIGYYFGDSKNNQERQNQLHDYIVSKEKEE